MDHEDAHTVTVDLPLLRFEKTAINVTTGDNPAVRARPGDTLRYRIYVQNLSDSPLNNFTLRDELGRLNTAPVYVPGSLRVTSSPAGADLANTNASGGANNAGIVDIRNLNLDALNSSIIIEYEVRLAPVLPNNSYVAKPGAGSRQQHRSREQRRSESQCCARSSGARR